MCADLLVIYCGSCPAGPRSWLAAQTWATSLLELAWRRESRSNPTLMRPRSACTKPPPRAPCETSTAVTQGPALGQVARPAWLTRRSILRLSGLVGIGLATGYSASPGADAVKQEAGLQRVFETRLAMGTIVSITAIHPSRLQAQAAIGATYDEISRLTRLLNRFDRSTPVALLNRQGWLDDAPAELRQVVGRALSHFWLSGGAFDISIQPVVDLFRLMHAAGRSLPPPVAALREALCLVDARDIILDRRRLRFARPGMGITLDGIAKGYVVDRASAVLSRHGIRNHLVNAGGDIRARGRGRDQRPWRVAVQDPRKAGAPPSIFELTDGAVATSGNYEVYYDREQLFHHIANPVTGLCPDAVASVSVLARTAMDADALSTAVFLMDPGAGTRFIDSLPGCECLMLTRDGTPVLSRGWPSARL
jgi:thiamine biosynthesis lipoprotein